jgi:hypothetical protein
MRAVSLGTRTLALVGSTTGGWARRRGCAMQPTTNQRTHVSAVTERKRRKQREQRKQGIQTRDNKKREFGISVQYMTQSTIFRTHGLKSKLKNELKNELKNKL